MPKTIIGNQMTKDEAVPLAVEIFVSDLDRTLKYYVNILGFKLHRIDKKGRFAVLKFNDAIFMIQEKDNLEELKQIGVHIRFIVNDVEKLYKTYFKKGAKIVTPLEKMRYGLTRFFV